MNYNNYLRGLYKRSKSLLLVSVTLFFSSLIIGVLIGYFIPILTGEFLTYYVKMLHQLNPQITTLFIFEHNLQSVLLTYIGGLIGIIPAGILVFNGFSFGAFLGYLMHGYVISNFGATTPETFLLYTIPHGVFEIPGFIIAGTAGFRLTTIIISILIKKNGERIEIDDLKVKDSLALLAISIILIFIAAIIEANITLPLGHYITSI